MKKERSHLIHNAQFTAQKMKFSLKDFFRKCDQITILVGVDGVVAGFVCDRPVVDWSVRVLLSSF